MVGWAEWRRNHFDHPTFAQGEILGGENVHCGTASICMKTATWFSFMQYFPILFSYCYLNLSQKMRKIQFSLLSHPIVNFKKLASGVLLTPIYWHFLYVIRKHSDWHSCQLLDNVLATPDCFLLKVVFQSLMGQAVWKRSLGVTVLQWKMIALDLTVTGTATIFVASAKERGWITAARKGRKTRIILMGHYNAKNCTWKWWNPVCRPDEKSLMWS